VVIVLPVPPAPPELDAVSLDAAELVVTVLLLLAPPTLLEAEVADALAPVVPLVVLALACDAVTGPTEVAALVVDAVPPMPVAGS